MQERGGSLRIHAGALHFPDRAVCRTETDNARPGLFRQQADGPVTARNWVVFPTPA
jgi:hypothetical protein